MQICAFKDDCNDSPFAVHFSAFQGAHATMHAGVVHKHTQHACYSLQALQALASWQLPQLYDPRPVTAFIT